MFVYVVLGRRKGGDTYVIAVYLNEPAALDHKRRWERRYTGGVADVQRFTAHAS